MPATPSGSDRQVPKNHPRTIRTTEILATLLLIHSAMFAWQYATQTPMVDFFVFWSVPHALSVKPATNIYTEEGRRGMGEQMAAEAQSQSTPEVQRQATYANQQDPLHNGKVDSHGTPFLYSMVGLLSSGDYDGDQKRFALVSGFCLAASVVMLGWLLRFSAAQTILLLAFLAADYAPVVTDMGVGNMNLIQLFGVALFILLAGRSRHLWAGVAIGLATMVKPTTAIVLALAVIVALADRDYRRILRLLAGAAAAGLGAVAVSSLYFGNPKMWIEFVKNLSGTLGDGSYPLEKGNYGLAKLLFGGTGPGPAVILVVLLGIFAWVVFTTRRKAPGDSAAVANAFAAAGVGCTVMLLSSPLAWVHYYVLLIPLALYAIHAGAERDSAPSWSGMAWKLAAFLPLLLLSDLAQYLLSGTPRTLSTAFNMAALVALGLAMLEIRRQRGLAAVAAVVEKRKK